MSVVAKVRSAVAAAASDPRDAAAVALALTYAKLIDDEPAEAARVGPALLACLEALGLTPKARHAVKVVSDGAGKPASPLDELRSRRARKGTG
jgi:hypothetical protein